MEIVSSDAVNESESEWFQTIEKCFQDREYLGVDKILVESSVARFYYDDEFTNPMQLSNQIEQAFASEAGVDVTASGAGFNVGESNQLESHVYTMEVRVKNPF